MSELPKLEASMAFNWSIGSAAWAAFYKNLGQYPNDIAILSMLLYLQKISTGNEIFKIPLPLKMFLPILLMMKVKTFFCYLIFS